MMNVTRDQITVAKLHLMWASDEFTKARFAESHGLDDLSKHNLAEGLRHLTTAGEALGYNLVPVEAE